MDVRRLLKVYNYVNDEKTPKVNLKFAAVVAALLVSMGALLAYALSHTASGECPPDCTTSESQTTYVGLQPGEIASGDPDLTLQAQARLRDWRAEHPNYVVDDLAEVKQGGIVVGYNVTYHAATPSPSA